MFAGMNQRAEQPLLNLAMAKVYLSAKSEVMLERTWNDVLVDMEQSYRGPTLVRWRKVMKSAPFALLRSLRLLHTESTDFLPSCAILGPEIRPRSSFASFTTERSIWDGFSRP